MCFFFPYLSISTANTQNGHFYHTMWVKLHQKNILNTHRKATCWINKGTNMKYCRVIITSYNTMWAKKLFINFEETAAVSSVCNREEIKANFVTGWKKLCPSIYKGLAGQCILEEMFSIHHKRNHYISVQLLML